MDENLSRQIFLDPDIVSEIAKHYDFRSVIHRSDLLAMLKNIPGIGDLPEEKRDTFYQDILNNRKAKISEQYGSKVLEGTGFLRYDGYGTWVVNPRDFTYKLCLIYPLSRPLEIKNNKLTSEIGKLLRYSNLENIQSILPEDVLVWNLTRIAGKITVKYQDGSPPVEYQIYCNDTKRLTIIEYNNTGKSIETFKNKKLHSEGDKPASIKYGFGDDGNYIIKSEVWYKNGLLFRENDGYVAIGYGKDGRIVSQTKSRDTIIEFF